MVPPPIIIIFSIVKIIASIFMLFIFGFNLSQKVEINFFPGSLDAALKEAELTNKLVYVDCQTSWCAPCRREHPLLMKLSKNKAVKLIGLNYKDNINNAKKFINELGNPYSQILIDQYGTLAVEFGAYGVPETFLINQDKIIVKKFVGPINQQIIDEIKLIIK